MEPDRQLDPIDWLQSECVVDLKRSEHSVDLDEKTSSQGREEDVSKGLVEAEDHLGEPEPDSCDLGVTKVVMRKRCTRCRVIRCVGEEGNKVK